MMLSRRQQIDSLTGLRGVAACWVMLMHFREVTPTRIWQFPILDSIIANGAYGVDVFFVLSGFVISYAYEASFSSRLRWNDVYLFLAYRFARIYPVHLATFVYMELLFVAAILTSRSHGLPNRYDPITLLSSLTLTHDWIPGVQTPNMPAWSVSAEWFAYILFPALSFVLSRTRWSFLVFIVTGVGLGWFQHLGTYGPAHVLSGFLLGMAAYQLRPYLGRISGICIAGPVVAATIVFWARNPEPPMAAGLLLFAVLVITLANPRDFLSRVLSRPKAVYLGEISYSLYMVHWPVRITIRYGLDAAGFLNLIQPPILVFLYISASLMVAVASYHYIEIPGRARLRRMAGAPGRSQVSPAVSRG
jgi:peptidoglycan/LPS O-acetylase OafA/YrhL